MRCIGFQEHPDERVASNPSTSIRLYHRQGSYRSNIATGKAEAEAGSTIGDGPANQKRDRDWKGQDG
jgi:hypothetical protein